MDSDIINSRIGHGLSYKIGRIPCGATNGYFRSILIQPIKYAAQERPPTRRGVELRQASLPRMRVRLRAYIYNVRVQIIYFQLRYLVFRGCECSEREVFEKRSFF